MSLKNKIEATQLALDEANFQKGKLLFMAESLWFCSYKHIVEKNIISIIFDGSSPTNIEILHEIFARKIDKPRDSYVLVEKNEPLLFLGFVPIETELKFETDKTNYNTYNRQNYHDFYLENCEIKNHENYKNILKQAIEIDFKYPILQFLYKNQILWWSFETFDSVHSFVATFKENLNDK